MLSTTLLILFATASAAEPPAEDQPPIRFVDSDRTLMQRLKKINAVVTAHVAQLPVEQLTLIDPTPQGLKLAVELPHLQALYLLYHSPEAVPKGWHHLASSSSLSRLDVCIAKDQALDNFHDFPVLPGIRTVKLYSGRSLSTNLSQWLPHVEEVIIEQRGSGLDDHLPTLLAGCTHLKTLRIISGEFTGRALLELSPFEHLETLELSGCGRLCDEAIAGIGQQSNLKSIEIGGANTGRYSASALHALGALPRLTSLHIRRRDFDDDMAAALKDCVALRSLSLVGAVDFTGSSLSVLNQLPLESIDLRDTGLKARHRQLLDEFRTLKEIHVSSSVARTKKRSAPADSPGPIDEYSAK